MTRVVSTFTLWAAICLQFAFFLILCTLYVWREKSLSIVDHSSIMLDLHLPRSRSHAEKVESVHAAYLKKLSDPHYQKLSPNIPRPIKRHRPIGTELHTLEYKYSLNPAGKVCNEPVYLLVIVESTTYNAMEREYFRTRWKTTEYHNKKIATVFVTARSSLNTAEELLEYEFKKYGDILHIDFADSYRNLTLKTMLSLRWAVDECQPFKYLMKTDDDMIINFDVLINQLEQLPSNITTDLYTGFMMSNKPPIRDESDKWHVTHEEYPHDRYPDYMGGPGYILAYQAVVKVISASYHVPFMPMEDVFVGICAKKAGISGYSNLRYSNWEIWDYYSFCWARQMAILHKPYFSVRELYYYDKFINSNNFDFHSWQRHDLYAKMEYSQKTVNRDNVNEEYVGYPMVYRCSSHTWQTTKEKSLFKYIVKWKIPRERIIEI